MSGKVITVTLNPSIDKTIRLNRLVPYKLNRAKSTRTDPGGKGINVGKVLKNFGVDVTVTGFLAGRQGDILLEELLKSGISADFIRVPGETRTNLKIMDERVGRITEINEQGFVISQDSMDSLLMKLKTLSKGADIVVLSGSLPPGPPADFYATCIEISKYNGAKVILDADGAALYEGLQAKPYAVKPNLEELWSLYHTKLNDIHDVSEAAGKLIDKGVSIAIVSMGPEGAVYATKDEIIKADSWNIPVKSTVGAGDSMVGALVYSILRGDSLDEIARLSVAAATVTVSKEGTQFCSIDEVESMKQKVLINRLERNP